MNNTINALLVEDNTVAQLAAKGILKKKNITATVASTGKEGIEIAKNKKFDFILMDVGLEPGTDGIMVIKEIQTNSLNKDTPIIFLTSNSAETYQDRLNDIKFIKYIVKPMNDKQLEEILAIINNK
ncbi:MAG: response regulator [Silvanigrellaceae bacterium]|nr:response regulator [Silvanigrellaceae bacterium]